ncbi:hypothetical protein FKP32DRAFT_1595464 [Trametes sanguinea]|nr:hypothetical protein FKP32DRAFT_1595464 [Trametes sanguinea]
MKRTVINVSSRESSPNPPRRSSRRADSRSRPKPLPSTNDVIELTDSDSDEFPAKLSQHFAPRDQRARRVGKARAEPIAGPSRAQAAAPVPSPLLQPARAPSPSAALPLFLPDLDIEASGDDVPVNGVQPLELGGAPSIQDRPNAHLVGQPPAAPVRASASADVPAEQQDGRDPLDRYVAQVLEIIPDVSPAHAYSLIEQHYPSHLDKVLEHVLHILFEDPSYPKSDSKGKRRREDDGEPERAVKPKLDYGSVDRKREGGPHYIALAIEQLTVDFPDIPTAHIRATFDSHNWLYAPAFLALREHQTLEPLPYRPITRPRPKGKGKAVALHDEELEKEMRWIREKIDEEESKKAAQLAEERRLEEEGGIECGCCFCEYPFDKMIQCPEAHLFCTSCMMTYAETKLGEHDARIVCMDQSGCKLPFPESELRRFLTPKLLDLYERVKQRKEIEAAGLENLEECPFCDYKVVIENVHERLFRCENETCGAVTCRQCKKPDHLPKSCEEVSDDKKLGVRHAIEEAMTRALMRNCPKCQKGFIKEMGCNKMTCPNCAAVSCYVCRKLITGYEHFANPPPYNNRKADPKKCPLWDSSVEGRHSDEVTAAAKQAIEEYKRTHPEFDEKDIAVDLPPPAPAAGPSRHGVPGLPPPLPVLGFDRAYVELPPPPVRPRHPRRNAEREARADLVQLWRRQVDEQPHAAHAPPPAPFPQQVFFPPIAHDPFHLHAAALHPPFHAPVIPPPPAPAPAPPRAPVVPPRRSRRAHARRAN